MVTTRSRMARESDDEVSDSSPHNQTGRNTVDAVSRAEFEELRRQNEEMGQALREMMKASTPQNNIQARTLGKEAAAGQSGAGFAAEFGANGTANNPAAGVGTAAGPSGAGFAAEFETNVPANNPVAKGGTGAGFGRGQNGTEYAAGYATEYAAGFRTHTPANNPAATGGTGVGALGGQVGAGFGTEFGGRTGVHPNAGEFRGRVSGEHRGGIDHSQYEENEFPEYDTESWEEDCRRYGSQSYFRQEYRRPYSNHTPDFRDQFRERHGVRKHVNRRHSRNETTGDDYIFEDTDCTWYPNMSMGREHDSRMKGKKQMEDEEADSPQMRLTTRNLPTSGVEEKESLEKMVERVLEKKKLVSIEEGQRRRVPFASRIMNKPLPRKFKMPHISQYTGKSDPHDHIQSYESLMLLHGWEDEIMCRAFSLTLTGHALKWFNSLVEGSIHSFDMLRSEFLKAFVVNSARKKEATYLLSLKQGVKESLRNFVDRFRDATLEVRDLQPGVAVAAMLQGTKSEDLQKSLSLDPPPTLSDLFIRANKYISQKEVMKTISLQENKEGKKREREKDFGPNVPVKKDRVDGSPRLKFSSFTPLRESRSTILAAIEKSGMLEFPKKVEGNLGRNTHFYCHFHSTNGHSTNQCHELMNQIERLAREGKLNRFLQRGGAPRYQPRDQRFGQARGERNDNTAGRGAREEPQERREMRRDQREENEPTAAAINTIAGGDSRGGDSSSSRKSYAREAFQINSVMQEKEDEEPIIFTPADKGDVIIPHDDPMVTSGEEINAKRPTGRE